MFFELKKENIIVDLESLIKKANDFDEETSAYAQFMKERILSVTGNN